MAAEHAYTLRPLERDAHGTLLEGAFRVHLPSIKDLKALKASQGDLVRLSDSEGPKGVAVAWLATPNPGAKIAKVPKLLRDTYELSLNSSIFVEKVDKAWRPIIAINIGFPVTPETLTEGGYSSKEDLLFWCRQALGGPCPIYFASSVLLTAFSRTRGHSP